MINKDDVLLLNIQDALAELIMAKDLEEKMSSINHANAEDLTTSILTLEKDMTILDKRCEEADTLMSIIHEQCARSKESIGKLKVELL